MKKNSKAGNLFMGLVFIMIGIGWILLKLGYADHRAFIGIFVTWPLALVVIGISVIFRNRFLSSLLWILFILGTVGYGYVVDNNDSYFEVSYSDYQIEQNYSSGKISIDTGAGNIVIDSTDEKLITAEYPDFINEKFDVEKGKVEFKYVDKTRGLFNFIERTDEKFNYKLNNDLNWDIDINCGAISGDLDLRDLYINNLEIDCGASDLILYLSQKSDLSTIDIDNGASDIIVYVPSNVGVILNYDGAIKDMEFGDVSWVRKNDDYYSPDYEKKTKKTIILVDSGIGNIEFKYLDEE